jgi:hypothetical protein
MTLHLTAEITVRIPLAVPDGTDAATLAAALDSLADVMMVQAEDGVYSAGSPDADEVYEEGPGDAPGRYVPNVHVAAVGGRMTTHVGTYPTPTPDRTRARVAVVAVAVPTSDDYGDADIRDAVRARLGVLYPSDDETVVRVTDVAVTDRDAWSLFTAAAGVGLDGDVDDYADNPGDADRAWTLLHDLHNS